VFPWSVSAKKSKSKHLPPVADRRTLYPRVTTAAVELLLFTGCRLSEVLNLAWDRVDMNAGELTLDETKSGEPQTVVISAPARRVLTELAKLQGIKVTDLTGSHKTKGWVLPSRNDHKRPLSKAAIEQAWQRIRTVAKLEDVHLHDLRHTAGTVAGRTGANAFLVRDLLRHSDLATTSIYVNRDDNPVRTLSDQVAQQIDASLSGRPVAEVVPLKRA